ncbi:SRPBCC domain-containing protein [Arthrobacter sp. I2-34]|uniref:SRPBCC domain-containing protein n=1 Tax=Arthrobacter hankyongi TaxID=2904801 RepID=A0ABS9L820_9MICC|nr:SRPBCC domain-containing protein [Arthrobacter hankyongi]MCG2622824.1 SRPBCC domain-containing protein [Arthrobacter hankyongi]
MSDSTVDTETEPLSVHINADARQVWVMLREPSRLAQWHGWETEGLDEEIELIYFSDAVESADHRSLTLGGRYTFTLEPVGDGTKVTVARSGAAPGPNEPPEEDVREGWQSFLQQLRFALERHPNDKRQTTYFQDNSAPHGGAAHNLGLDKLPAPGEDYEATLGTGESLAGKVWFRSAHQVGLTVRSYAGHGDGLLIVADLPATPTRPDGGTQVLITSYGLGAKALSELRSKWDGWRTRHFPSSEPLVIGNEAGPIAGG